MSSSEHRGECTSPSAAAGGEDVRDVEDVKSGGGSPRLWYSAVALKTKDIPMARVKRGLASALPLSEPLKRPGEPAGNLRSLPSPSPAGVMRAVLADGLDEERRAVTLRLGKDERIEAELDAALDPIVVRTAIARNERLIAVWEGGVWLVLGALRTSPTPGVDAGDHFVIEARRVEVKAQHEFAVVTGKASFVMRAHGLIESLAQDITTRASSVHKLIGRMLRLN